MDKNELRLLHIKVSYIEDNPSWINTSECSKWPWDKKLSTTIFLKYDTENTK